MYIKISKNVQDGSLTEIYLKTSLPTENFLPFQLFVAFSKNRKHFSKIPFFYSRIPVNWLPSLFISYLTGSLIMM